MDPPWLLLQPASQQVGAPPPPQHLPRPVTQQAVATQPPWHPPRPVPRQGAAPPPLWHLPRPITATVSRSEMDTGWYLAHGKSVTKVSQDNTCQGIEHQQSAKGAGLATAAEAAVPTLEHRRGVEPFTVAETRPGIKALYPSTKVGSPQLPTDSCSEPPPAKRARVSVSLASGKRHEAQIGDCIMILSRKPNTIKKVYGMLPGTTSTIVNKSKSGKTWMLHNGKAVQTNQQGTHWKVIPLTSALEADAGEEDANLLVQSRTAIDAVPTEFTKRSEQDDDVGGKSNQREKKRKLGEPERVAVHGEEREEGRGGEAKSVGLETGTVLVDTDFPTAWHDTVSVGAFMDRHDVVKVILPLRIRKIGAMAFLRCSNLKECTVPSGVLVGSGAFKECGKLRATTVLGSADFPAMWSDTVPKKAFAHRLDVVKVVLPFRITKIDTDAFWGCSNLEEFVVSPGVEVSYRAFYGCSKLRATTVLGDADFPAKWGSIVPNRAFRGRLDVMKAEVPAWIETISDEAFDECRNLEECVVPPGVKVGSNAFSMCSKLLGTTVLGDMDFPAEWGDTVPDMAFKNRPDIVKVVFPPRIKTIGKDAFYECSNLVECVVPLGTELGSGAFYGCLKLQGGGDVCECRLPGRVGWGWHSLESKPSSSKDKRSTGGLGGRN